MAFPERTRAQPRLEESTNIYDDGELLRSLNKLSISTSPITSNTTPTTSRLSRSPNSNAHSNSTPTRLSSVSPGARAPSRSPVNRSNSNGFASQSRSATPALRSKASMNSLHSSSGITPNRALSRRSSSTNLLSPSASKSPLNGPTQIMEEFNEKPAPTAASVASGYMQKELELLHEDSTDHQSETVVVLHDACYGHRFSRPRPTKGTLNSIVERPERIQASVLGVSMAYVRLGERHCDGRYPIHPQLDPTSLPNVPFRICKTNRTLALNSTAVTNVHGTQWMDELKMMCDSAESNLSLKKNEVRRPDINRGSNASPPRELHDGDLYLCSESLNAFEGALGAVCDAVDRVFNSSPYKRAFVAVRPPGHHCSASHPSGFCWVNNVHVGIMHGFLNHGLTHAAIIDFDLHHGDGSQAIAWAHNQRGHASFKNAPAWKKTSIGYFSVHDINSYPCEMGDEDKVRNASVCVDNAHGQSIWNVHLQEWKSDVEFWRLYQSKYSMLLEKARCYLRTQTDRFRAAGQAPKAAIFLSAGFDASEWESAGMQRHKVNVPTEFYARITRDVVKLASEEGLGVEGRVISVLEGGYSDRALYSGVLSHLSGLAGNESLSPKEETSSGLGYEMSNRIGSLSRRNTLTENEMKLKTPGFPYDPTWWSASELDQLDAAMMMPCLEQPKKPRNFIPGNYSSPTQASSLRAVDPTKVRRSVSGFAASISRPPTPPPPDVPWTVAAHELSKLLIPQDRQINSYKYEELNAEATKARRERQSLLAQSNAGGSAGDEAVPAPAAAPTRMSLRERKPIRPTGQVDSEDSKTRRRTVGGSTVATEKALARGIPVHNGSGPTRQFSGASMLAANGAAGAIPRPVSSQSIRPESAMSVRTQASTALNVRKTRPAAPVRKESSRAPKKPKTVAAKTEGTSLPVKKEHSVASSGEPSTAAVDSVSDMERITNGLKKIKINVLTKEKKEARQKAEAEKRTAEKKADQEVKTMGEAKFLTPVLPTATEDEHLAAPYDLPPHPRVEQYNSMNISTSPKSSQIPPPSGSSTQGFSEIAQDEGIFVHYRPDGPPPITSPISGPVRILEPSTIAPAQLPTFNVSSVPSSPARKGGHAFTPTSSIPFAPRPVQETRSMSKDNAPIAQSPHKTETMDERVWEIPETPQH